MLSHPPCGSIKNPKEEPDKVCGEPAAAIIGLDYFVCLHCLREMQQEIEDTDIPSVTYLSH